MNPVVHNLFPTPIYQADLREPLSDKILKNADKLMNNSLKNRGNKTSQDNHVLDKPLYLNLKKECQFHLDEYYKNIINTKNNVTPYITQSWLNVTKENEYHHIHNHRNSVISGVVYFNADPSKDSIRIYKAKIGEDYCLRFLMYPKEYNTWNSESWALPVKSNSIMLFSSYLLHSVDVKNSNNTRVSLAFNTFIKGKLGDQVSLDMLEI